MPKPAKRRKAAWEDMMKQSIFEATVSVMNEYGPEGVRMDRVAKAAEMATGTLYNYFKDKTALLFHAIDTLFDPYHEELLSIQESDSGPREKLGAYIHLTCRYLNEKRDIITILMRAKNLWIKSDTGRDPEEDLRTTVVGVIYRIIEEGISKGVFHRCDVTETAAMIYGAMDGFAMSKINGQAPERTLEKDVENCTAFILPGLLAAS